MQCGKVHQFKSGSLDFLDSQDRIDAPAILVVVAFHVAAGVVNHGINSTGFECIECHPIHGCATFRSKVVVVAESQNHVRVLHAQLIYFHHVMARTFRP